MRRHTIPIAGSLLQAAPMLVNSIVSCSSRLSELCSARALQHKRARGASEVIAMRSGNVEISDGPEISTRLRESF
jgi:hypothetical protein